jgi:signal transduction histidine kinase/CheY-like chemotaxis protein
LQTVAIISTIYFSLYLFSVSIIAVCGRGNHRNLHVYLIWFFPLLVFNKLVNEPVVGQFLAKGLLVAPVLLLISLSSRLIAVFTVEDLIQLGVFCISYLGYGLMFDTATGYREEYIAERERSESIKVEMMAAEAQAASKAKTMFLSTMSHEIRTPMNAILGYSQLLARDPALGTEARACLKIINRSGEHLLTIINDVLDMAKIEAGGLHLTVRVFDLRELMHDLEAMFSLRAAAKGLQFRLHMSGDSVEYILADPGKIRQVLINLLGNAIKFTERGRIDLRVSVHSRPTDGQLLLSVQVVDTGLGMTPDEQSRMFRPFAQGLAGQRVRGGTGLGLAISQGAAQVMGGSITVSSKPGEGSSFHFEIPVGRGFRQDVRVPFTNSRVTHLAPGQAAPRILIADDAPDNRGWLSSLLTAVGFSVRWAENGEAAVTVWEDWRPHLILMDMHMPVMSGLEATRQIKSSAEGKATVIIALTADVMDDRRRIILDSNADDFLSKPCPENELLDTIRAHLGLEYLYEDEPVNGTGTANLPKEPVALSAEQLTELPSDLIRKLHEATLSGDKVLLNRLIDNLEELRHNDCARGLRELADGYQYRRLIDLLEQACG